MTDNYFPVTASLLQRPLLPLAAEMVLKPPLFVKPKANTSHGLYQCTKFKVSSLSRSRDILGGLKIKSGSRDVTEPFSGTVCRP